MQFKTRRGKQTCITLNDFFRRYLEFTTLLPDKAKNWGFHLVIMYINSLSPELKLKVVAAGYHVPNITI